MANELNLDLNYTNLTYQPKPIFSNNWLKTNNSVATASVYINVKTGASLNYRNKGAYDFTLPLSETQAQNFSHPKATADASKFLLDLKGAARNTTSVTAGAYEVN